MQPKFDSMYRALVTSNVDPTGLNKIKVQCPQIGATVEIRAAEPINAQEPIPNVGSLVWVGFSGGDITKPYYTSNTSFIRQSPDGSFLSIVTSTPGVLNDALGMYLVAGVGGQVTGNSTPFVKIIDSLGTSDADLLVSGSVIRTNTSGTKVTWQTPTMGTGWATGSGIGGAYPPLMWRYDAEDNIHIMGVFHATTTSVSSIIASGFQSVLIGGANVGIAGAIVGINVSNRVANGYLNSSGELRVSTLGTVAANDTFSINAKVPIGSLP